MAWHNTSQQSRPEEDPLSAETSPSLSFKDAVVGTVQRGIITKIPHWVQSRDFETRELATWPDGNPKMSVVIGLEVDGEARSVWALKPSSMYAALVQAQKEAGVGPMEEGGLLELKFVGTVPNSKNPRLNEAKQYAARYTPPKKTDPFGETPAAEKPVPPQTPDEPRQSSSTASRPVPKF